MRIHLMEVRNGWQVICKGAGTKLDGTYNAVDESNAIATAKKLLDDWAEHLAAIRDAE